MSNIDNRIVSMTFDNENFERKLAGTLASLDKLTESLRFAGAVEGFEDISKAAGGLDLADIGDSVDNISDKFSAMGAVAFTVIQELTTAVLDFARATADKVIGPIMSGGMARALNLEQARFLFEGLGADVEAMMASALKAVEGTAYGLDVAAKAAAQLGGSGLKAGDDMTGALRGIAGIAAMTNSSYEEMADIFISAAGKGKVMSNELARISHRGVNAAAALAKEWGVTEAEVRQMASEGEISFEKFAKGMDDAFGEHSQKANQTYTGSLANMRAAMSRLGASLLGPHLNQQRDLFNALRPVIDEVHDSLKPLINTFVFLKGIATANFIKTIEGLDLSKLKLAIPNFSDGFANLFTTFQQLRKVVKDAFKDVFPSDFGSVILRISEAFKNLTERIKMGGKTIDNVKSIFRGIFAAISIVIEVIKGVAGLFKALFTSIASAVGLEGKGVLQFFATIGDSIFDLKKALVDGKGITKFFESLGEAIQNPAIIIAKLKEAISGLGNIFANLFGGGEIPGAKGAADSLGRVQSRFGHIQSTLEKVGDKLSGLFRVLDVIWTAISNWFEELGAKLAAVMKPGDFNAVIDMLNAGLIGGILVVLKKFMDGGLKLDFTGGLLDKIGGALDQLTGVLKGMQLELKAKALLKIAIAIAVLTASVLVLSMIDSVALTKALTAMSVGFAQLVATMVAMEKISLGASAIKITILSAAMILLATASLILAAAITVLSKLGWEELAKGLIGVGGGLAIMVMAVNGLSTNTGAIIRAGISMIAIAIAMRILANAMQAFATMNWGEIGKGLVSVGGSLVLLVQAMNRIDAKDMISAGLGIIAIAIGMRILANAMQAFAEMSWEEMAKGLISVTLGLGAIVLLTNTMPKGGMIGIGIGLIAVGIALNIMAKALASIGKNDMGTLAKGIGAIAAMMLVLVVATNAMSGALPGATALVVVAGALHILADVLKELAKLSIAELVTGLAAIAAVLLVLGGGSLLLAGVIPTMMGLGVALLLIGAGFALFGAGAALVAKAFEVLAHSAKGGAKAIVEGIEIVLASLPKMVTAMARSLLGVVTEFVKGVPILLKALKVVILHVLDTIIDVAPKLADALLVLIKEGIRVFIEATPDFVKAGFNLIVALLKGLRDNIGEIVVLVSDIITEFLDAFNEEVPDLITSLVNLLVTVFKEVAFNLGLLVPTLMIGIGQKFIEGFWQGITQELGRLGEVISGIISDVINWFKSGFGIFSPSKVMLEIGKDIIRGLLNGIVAAAKFVRTWFVEFPIKILQWIGNLVRTLVNKGIDLIGGLLSGIVNKAKEIITFYRELPGKILGWIGNVAGTLKDKGSKLIVGLLNGIYDKAKTVTNWFINLPGKVLRAVGNLGSTLVDAGKDIIRGLWNGIVSMKDWLVDKAESIAGWVTNPVQSVLDLFSPSRVFMGIGINVVKGLIIGLNAMASTVKKASGSIGDNVKEGWEKANVALLVPVSKLDEFNPTITPVLDLSRVQADAKKLDKFLDVASIAPVVSINRANEISGLINSQNGSESEPVSTEPRDVTFIQNNHSPEALSTADIYRQTKSQFALAKEELGVA